MLTMKSDDTVVENGESTLRARSILGLFLVALAVKDLLAWAEFTSPDSGWLVRVTGLDWTQPFVGLALAALGVVWAGPNVMQCFAVRDNFRKNARRYTMICGLICAVA